MKIHPPNSRTCILTGIATAAAMFLGMRAAAPDSVMLAIAAPSQDVAVIVGAKTPADNLSMGDLRAIMLGDRQFWSAGNRITVLIRAPAAHTRDVVLKKVYQMSEAQFRQYWIAKVFRAEIPSGPKVVYSDDSAEELVATLPGAIAFVDAGDAPKGVKVVRIAGHKPGEKGYPLD